MRRDLGDVRERRVVTEIVERVRREDRGGCPRGDVGEAGAVREVADRPEDAGCRGGSNPARRPPR